jgi:hypothetical protein
LCNFLHSPVTSSLFGANILLRTLFSNTLSLCSSLNVKDQVSHPYRTNGGIIMEPISIALLILHQFICICSTPVSWSMWNHKNNIWHVKSWRKYLEHIWCLCSPTPHCKKITKSKTWFILQESL